MDTHAPYTPRKTKEQQARLDDIKIRITTYIKTLNREWDLKLELPETTDSPSKHFGTLEGKCVYEIKFLFFKDAIEEPREEFDTQAFRLYAGWIRKPRGEVPSVTRQHPRPVSAQERVKLLNLLYQIMRKARENCIATTPHRGQLAEGNINVQVDARPPIDDNPVPFPLSDKAKRNREQPEEAVSTFKKPKIPDTRVASVHKVPLLERRRTSPENRPSRSARTSFASNPPSIFDGTIADDTLPTLTQITAPDESLDFQSQPPRDTGHETQSSEYEAGSSFDAALLDAAASHDSLGDADALEAETIQTEVNEQLSQNLLDCGIDNEVAEARLRDCLRGVFPDMPPCLLDTPLHVRYEYYRVFLHTGVPFKEIRLPFRPDWSDYDALWTYLRQLPALKGKVFPERTEKQVWAAVQNEFHSGSRGICMSGSIRYHSLSDSCPLFDFQLLPLKLEKTYRLSRRFGCDRFLELDMPNLTGKRVPSVLRDMGRKGKPMVIDWLFEEWHRIFGRCWVPFCQKPKEGGKQARIESDDIDKGVDHRVWFFAVEGHNFQSNSGTPKDSETVESRSAWTVEGLLNWLRPTRQNKDEASHKLYARTILALSRNTATIVLRQSQIRYKKDILNDRGEKMTDGAGRLSLTLALRIREQLGLAHLPSGFQGRIGSAKGFWTINHQDHGLDEWIEVYDSQRKWERKSGQIDDLDFSDSAHRTFEVNKYSGKLKSADLNLQLVPILMDRATSKVEMRQALENILEEGLEEESRLQRVAMNDPKSFRKWIRDNNAGLTDRVKYGVVQYKSALPVSLDERLNMFLDAGFDPKKLQFLRELATKAYTRKCDELKKRLNITVAHSTYAFMVPDFAGVLEPDEIYLHLSKNIVGDDELEVDPMAGLPLHDMDVLVARSPAHYVSDVQRVKAVVKVELMGLKDVIVFPTKTAKGQPSLAAKLSGGDYDGDLAWVCWDQSIVSKFENHDIPKIPDLVKEGHITKDTTTYDDILKSVLNKAMATTKFLKHNFEFNLEKSMLGICTNWKDELCYAQKRVDSKRAVLMSTLLSNLVDQSKQGYLFTEDHWNILRTSIMREIKQQFRKPDYKSGTFHSKSTHILDRLMYVADMAIEKTKKDLHDSFPDTAFYDASLVAPFKWAKNEAETNHEWRGILDKLKLDIDAVKDVWTKHFGSAKQAGDSKNFGQSFRSTEEEKIESGPVIGECYEMFRSIKPVDDTPLTRLLLESWHCHPELSGWARLKASALFASYSFSFVSNLVWWVAGVQLCHIKATSIGGSVAMTPQMYAMLKPDSTFVKLRLSEDTYEWQYKDDLKDQGVSAMVDSDNEDDWCW